MNKKIFLLFLAYNITLVSTAQRCKMDYLGSKTLYRAGNAAYIQPPKGYYPVFINHVGRHGARHLTKDVTLTYAYTILQKADSLNGLTASGKLLKSRVWNLAKIERKDHGNISMTGQQEQKNIALRMYLNNQHLFKDTALTIDVAYSSKVRTKQTADALLSGLEMKMSHNPRVIAELNDTITRFYDMSPAYITYKDSGNWIDTLSTLKKYLNFDYYINRITKRIFTTGFLKNISSDKREKFVSDIFGFNTIIYSLQKEILQSGFTATQVNFNTFFNCAELKALGEIDDAEDFLSKGPGIDASGVQVRIALPLLIDFIKATDNYIRTNSVSLNLRFTHAEAIAPFAALLGIEGSSQSSHNIKTFENIWSAKKTIPLSANIQWILYRKKGSENYLIKFLLNEKPVHINGVTTNTFPFYNWEDIRKLYINKIGEYNSNLNENGFNYLQALH